MKTLSMVDINITERDEVIFAEIEKIRDEIISADIELSFMDFGAVSPNMNLSQEEMYRGRPVTRSTKDVCKQGLKGDWAVLLYFLVKNNKPNNILELGTCCGFSAIYMSKGNPDAIIYTIEGAAPVADIARKNYIKAGCSNIVQVVGRFQDVLLKTLQEMRSVDFAFIDGHHDRGATINYFSHIKPFLSKGAIVVFDDISWSKGMREAWYKIVKDGRITRFEDLQKMGICYIE
ncbi:MAG: class I SAM-dependent methyltransferase [Nitrospirota bacterium]